MKKFGSLVLTLAVVVVSLCVAPSVSYCNIDPALYGTCKYSDGDNMYYNKLQMTFSPDDQGDQCPGGLRGGTGSYVYGDENQCDGWITITVCTTYEGRSEAYFYEIHHEAYQQSIEHNIQSEAKDCSISK